jgi:hypothetical protein
MPACHRQVYFKKLGMRGNNSKSQKHFQLKYVVQIPRCSFIGQGVDKRYMRLLPKWLYKEKNGK